MKKWITLWLVRPLIALEPPGWGKLYAAFVGGYKDDASWARLGPRMVRDKRHGCFRVIHLGHWADRSLYFLRRWYELATELVLERFIQPGDRICDVGANFGHFTMAAASTTGADGTVLAFEPNPKAFARLSLHAELNRLHNVQLHNVGIADKASQLTLHIPRVNSGEATFGETRYDQSDVVECPVHKLDEVDGIGSVAFIKIDVEGFEVHVLRGAARIIADSRPYIFTEIVRQHLANAGESPESLAEVLRPHRYVPFQIKLARAGLRHRLKLVRNEDLNEDGNYLWLPEEKQSEAD